MRRLLPLFLCAATLCAGPGPDLEAAFARERALQALQDRILDVTKGEAQCGPRLLAVLAPKVRTVGFGFGRTRGAVLTREALIEKYTARQNG